MTSTTKAIVLSKLGGFGAFEIRDVTVPLVGPRQVRVRVHEFGKLDILVNNAAIAAIVVKGTAVDDPAHDPLKLDHLWQVNVMGAIATTRANAPVIENGGRTVLNGTYVRFPCVADYAGNKAAINGYARSFARDLGPRGITVNVVQPRAMPTDMMDEALGSTEVPDAFLNLHPIRRIAKPEEVASVVTFLAGPTAGRCGRANRTTDGRRPQVGQRAKSRKAKRGEERMRPLASELPSMTLVLGGTGKTGSRVAERLWNAGGPVRLGHRSDAPRFDWTDPATWPRTLAGASAVYVAYQPDIVLPEAAGRVAAFAEAALAAGARRLVLLSRRGQPGAERAEDALRASGADWTVIRASLLMQNFSEGGFLPTPSEGRPALPASAVCEPFIDAGDVADVVLRVLADPGYVGRTLDLAGPQILTFRDALAAITAAARAPAARQLTPPDIVAERLARKGVSDGTHKLTRTPFDAQTAPVTSGIEAVLGRPARRFADFAAEAARAEAWVPPEAEKTTSHTTA